MYGTGYPPLPRVDKIIAKLSGRQRSGSTVSDHKSQRSDYHIRNALILINRSVAADRSRKSRKVEKDNCIQTHNKVRGERVELNFLRRYITFLKLIDQIKQPMQKQSNNNILFGDYR